jgi:hypothetical protein
MGETELEALARLIDELERGAPPALIAARLRPIYDRLAELEQWSDGQRREFAAMAMQGILASGASPGDSAMFPKPPTTVGLDAWLAATAIDYADALIAALESEGDHE